MYDLRVFRVLGLVVSTALWLAAPGTTIADEETADDLDAVYVAQSEAADDEDGGPAAAPRERPTTLEEITVTARKRGEELLQSVPISVTAFSEDRMEKLFMRDITSITAHAPNVGLGRTEVTPAGAVIFVRGVGNSDVEKTQDQAVMITLDGVPIGSMVGGVLDSFDMQSIEVLRGPQGTLFGRNSAGGVVNIKRTRPTGEFGMKGYATFGKFDRADYEIVTNLPALLDETLSIKLGWASFNDDGPYKSRFFGGYGPNKDRLQVTATALWTPTDSQEWLLTYENHRDRGESVLEHSMNAPPNSLPIVLRETGEFSAHPGEIACLANVSLSPAFYAFDPATGAPHVRPGTEQFIGALPGGLDGFTVGYDYCNDPLNPDTGTVDNDHNSNQRLDIQGYTLEGNIDIWGGTLTTVTGYRDLDENKTFDVDATPFEIFHVTRPEEFTQFSQEIRFAGDAFDGRLRHTTGVFAYHADHKAIANNLLNFLGIGFPGLPVFAPDGDDGEGNFVPGAWVAVPGTEIVPGVPEVGLWPGVMDANPEGGPVFGETFTGVVIPTFSGSTQETWAYALFGHYTFDLTDTVTLTYGGRWTWEEKEFTGCNFGAGFCTQDSEIWREYTPKYGVDYQATEDVMLYASFSTGFRSGGYNGRNSTPASIGPYDPETLRSWEFGFKSDWLDNRLRLNASYFDNEYQDKHETVITLDPAVGTITVIENAAEADIKGAEVELTAALAPGLTVGGSYGWIDAEYDEYTALVALLDGSFVTVDRSGNPVSASPEYQFGAWFVYERPLGEGMLSLNADYRFLDEVASPVSADPRVDVVNEPITNIGVNYSWEMGGRKYDVQAFVTNLTDNVWTTGGVYNPPWFGFNGLTRGREWGVKLGFEY